MKRLALLLLPSLVVLTSTLARADHSHYDLEPFPRVRFVVEGPLDDVEGLTRSAVGELNLSPDHWSDGKGTLSIELKSLRTGIDQRDDDMQRHFLDSAHFPRGLLQIDRVEGPTVRELRPGLSAEGEAVGSFELHGRRRALRFHVRVREDADGMIKVYGGFPIVLLDYGIERPERLFLKLGTVAQVTFEASFKARAIQPNPSSEVSQGGAIDETRLVAMTPTQKTVLPALPPPPRPVRKSAPPAHVIAYLYKDDASSPLSRGERMFNTAQIGGEGNTLSCAQCHASRDERKGLLQADGHIRPAHSMYGAGQRPAFWGGFTASLAKAVDICAKVNMRKPLGLPAATLADLSAFITSLSPDPSPELDYRVFYRTLESPLPNPSGGNVDRGRTLGFRYCMTCHPAAGSDGYTAGHSAKQLLPGLYPTDFLVRRLRRLEGNTDKQEPPWAIDRLPDSELRDIVTWLTQAPPVFPRRASAR